MQPIPTRSMGQLLIAISLLAIVVTLLAPRIGQDPAYHDFADQRRLLLIPNAFDVLSSLLLGVVGALGLYRLAVRKSLSILAEIHVAYLVFFLALVLIAIGSAFYHWSPDNESLVWDRLPITLAFMSFFTIMLGERVSPRLARSLLAPLLVAGMASIVYWHYSELAGNGDLRAYALLQFLPVVLIPLMLLLSPPRYSRNRDIWWFLAWFLLSRTCELLDHQIYAWFGVISGHSLKHIAVSIGCLVFLLHLYRRERLES